MHRICPKELIFICCLYYLTGDDKESKFQEKVAQSMAAGRGRLLSILMSSDMWDKTGFLWLFVFSFPLGCTFIVFLFLSWLYFFFFFFVNYICNDWCRWIIIVTRFVQLSTIFLKISLDKQYWEEGCIYCWLPADLFYLLTHDCVIRSKCSTGVIPILYAGEKLHLSSWWMYMFPCLYQQQCFNC